MEIIIDAVKSIFSVSDGCIDYLKTILTRKTFPKGSFLLEEGKIDQTVYFIERGVLRSYYYLEEKEVSSWFLKESDFAISAKSFFFQIPGIEYIQALEDTDTWAISYQQLQTTYANYPEFNIVGRKIVEKYYALETDKNYFLRLPTVLDRYRYICENLPWLVQRITAKNIASYLGVSEHRLSHIKAEAFTK